MRAGFSMLDIKLLFNLSEIDLRASGDSGLDRVDQGGLNKSLPCRHGRYSARDSPQTTPFSFRIARHLQDLR